MAVPDIIIDDMDDFEEGDDEHLFDSVCAICDNGGVLIRCEGPCLRSFHATVEAGQEADMCRSLGISEDEIQAMGAFFCKNCKQKQHQCFACGKLGSSDRESLKTEVFLCSDPYCGHFYHPHCIANLIHGDNVAEAQNLQQRIRTEGEAFTCPYHKCRACQGIEHRNISELQFAMCKRCPTSYHRACLPWEISFEDTEEQGLVTRAWENLLPNRILMYCSQHEIVDGLGTPARDHIKFP